MIQLNVNSATLSHGNTGDGDEAAAPLVVTEQEFVAVLFPDLIHIGAVPPRLNTEQVALCTPVRLRGTANAWPSTLYQLPLRGSPPIAARYVNWATLKYVEYQNSAGKSCVAPRATQQGFVGQYFLMLDDIGTKVTLPDEVLERATYILETSAGNLQVGFSFESPINLESSSRLRNALLVARMGDKGALGSPVRWCRVPESVNTKPGKNGFRARPTHWRPSLRYTLEALADLLQISLDRQVPAATARNSKRRSAPDRAQRMDDIPDRRFQWLRSQGMLLSDGSSSEGFFDVICPWTEEHSQGDSSGAGYRPSTDGAAQAFRCHHSHGRGKDVPGLYGTPEFLLRIDEMQIETLGATSGTLQQRVLAERAEARRLAAGDNEARPELSEKMTVEGMLDRFVYVESTNEVSDLRNPRLAMSPEHFRNATASSRIEVPDARNNNRARSVPCATMWLMSERRQRVETRTWLPGGGPFVQDPHGATAVNIWVPRGQSLPPADWEYRVIPFTDHLDYLIPDRAARERFLDWLAHIEQHPEELVHAHYLMIAPNSQGIGRNWLGSLAARLWRGNVALSVNIRSVLEGRFNAELSQKLLAVVDELHEGVAGAQWQFAEQLKSELTRETRRIKPKYGKEHDEHNRIRWLMLSNHLMALPLTDADRRLWVVENPTEPRDADYYTNLYEMLKAPGFIASVRQWLLQRDLSRFNPGDRAELSRIKSQMIESVRTDEDFLFDDLLETWPADVITQPELQQRILGERLRSHDPRHRVLRALLARGGGMPYPTTVTWAESKVRVAILRNGAAWGAARPDQIRAELSKAERATGRWP